ncbi:hypothetical protein E2C01_091392 [Portunus trituberculatus]|uniref:Uncharacterized protein n=1 Tax=Portunus trituberculatus TaxID=210409 RepID=A0A5B7JHD3_PORTR|nr:hypothetical protein [Portunus trituberculatus]
MEGVTSWGMGKKLAEKTLNTSFHRCGGTFGVVYLRNTYARMHTCHRGHQDISIALSSLATLPPAQHPEYWTGTQPEPRTHHHDRFLDV